MQCQASASSSERKSVFLDITVDEAAPGRVEIELAYDLAPLSCHNFEMLCTGQMKNKDPLFSLKVSHHITRT